MTLRWARRSKRLPVVLTKPEVQRVLREFDGAYSLIPQLLYGSGLRMFVCLRLRVQDLDCSPLRNPRARRQRQQ